jgi:hypothetical protein
VDRTINAAAEALHDSVKSIRVNELDEEAKKALSEITEFASNAFTADLASGPQQTGEEHSSGIGTGRSMKDLYLWAEALTASSTGLPSLNPLPEGFHLWGVHIGSTPENQKYSDILMTRPPWQREPSAGEHVPSVDIFHFGREKHMRVWFKTTNGHIIAWSRALNPAPSAGGSQKTPE